MSFACDGSHLSGGPCVLAGPFCTTGLWQTLMAAVYTNKWTDLKPQNQTNKLRWSIQIIHARFKMHLDPAFMVVYQKCNGLSITNKQTAIISCCYTSLSSCHRWVYQVYQRCFRWVSKRLSRVCWSQLCNTDSNSAWAAHRERNTDFLQSHPSKIWMFKLYEVESI